MWFRPADQRARALQYHHRAAAVGQLVHRAQPVGLHLGGAAAEQARGLQRMRRQQRRSALGSALAQRLHQSRISRQRVERVGIEQQPPGLRQQRRQPRGHRLAAAAAGHHGA